MSAKRIPKYRRVTESLRDAILSGRYEAGEKIPSEAELVKLFSTSRITVGRALRDLQREGLVERRAGSGTYVRARPAEGGQLLGLLIPDLGETEIFEPICQGMTQLPEAAKHALLWGGASVASGEKGERAEALCRRYVDRGVSGVFFAPLELISDKDEVNRRILEALENARIPVVLLDRWARSDQPRRTCDLVGIDNRRAGRMITGHLLGLGLSRIAFFAPPLSASTVEARIAGYREALFAQGAPVTDELVARLDPADSKAVLAFAEERRPGGFVCANDRLAGRLMHSLMDAGWRVPQDVAIVGIDDVEYASLLPVPLTTIRQPCREIGEVAMAAMLERLARPALPGREILLDVELVVRRSCGAKPMG